MKPTRIIFWMGFIVLAFSIVAVIHLISIGCGLRAMECVLQDIYLFHFLYTLLSCQLLLLLSRQRKYGQLLGFIYLGILVLRFFFFVLAFKDIIFNENEVLQVSPVHFLIPVFLGLFCEVYLLIRLLKKIEVKK